MSKAFALDGNHIKVKGELKKNPLSKPHTDKKKTKKSTHIPLQLSLGVGGSVRTQGGLGPSRVSVGGVGGGVLSQRGAAYLTTLSLWGRPFGRGLKCSDSTS